MYKNEERIPCPECNGKGFVYGSYDANTNGRNYFILGACPICSGEGTLTKEKQNKKQRRNHPER